MKSSNPKDAIASNKVPYHLIPATALAHVAVAAHEGNAKYGAHNYTVEGARASVYVAAGLRHVHDWNMGETSAADSRAHHLAHAIMCLAILLDNDVRGILVDDRPPSFHMATLHAELEAVIAEISARHADKNPRHYTIEDTPLHYSFTAVPTQEYVINGPVTAQDQANTRVPGMPMAAPFSKGESDA